MIKNSYSIATVENKRYEELEELLLKRDQLFRESGSYLTAYTKEFGDMLTANFELKVECIKKKKTISYCRRRLNRALPIDVSRMQSEIDHEMTLYYTQLKEMLENTDLAKKAKTISEFRLSRAKKIYRRLTKLLHPDINKKTAENERLMELWTRIAAAYQKSDVDELDDLEVLARKAMDDLMDDGFELDPDDIEKRIERIEDQINEILITEPYIYKDLLSDEERKRSYKEQLLSERDDYQHYLESLDQTLSDILREGGVKQIWKTH